MCPGSRRLAGGLLLPVLLAGLLSACASGPMTPSAATAPAPNVNLAGFPPEYRKAYGEGCAHARGGGASSQAPAFQQGAQQAAQGWRDGFDYCKRR
jgi:hypothetical protein